jgi:hypothetical protein
MLVCVLIGNASRLVKRKSCTSAPLLPDLELIQTRDEERKKAVRDALELVVAASVVSGDSKQVKKEVDAERAGIVVFRIP